ncbi:RES family NAD+ phosphorylase [Rhizorhabdus wittichii]|uniref:RES family NAD+ phosphorylase n=1 Tax=Rhizorhabdus wittichii TaxID=160791 RepID=UPI00031B6D3D|nr:RES family NAD+ phosphorylase [Rhizorhabdus wittichii]
MSTTIAPRSDPPPPSAEQFRAYDATLWRLVEAQHRISTNRLAANAEDQALLEELVETVKPVLPPAARGLHYLLATPFRYGHKKPSRFRRAGERPGIFYAAEHVATAVAETAYWRLLFFSRSPGFRPPTTVVEHSAFTVPVRVARLLDLSEPPYAASASAWTDPDDYAACQAFAGAARGIATQAIRYLSVRDPARRANVALLDPAAFAAATPMIRQTWHFRYEDGRMTAYAAFPSDERHVFGFEQFGLTGPSAGRDRPA